MLLSGMDDPAIKELLMILIGDATDIFERLPLVQDAHLMKSTLYAGVWQQYNKKMNGKGAKDSGTGSA